MFGRIFLGVSALLFVPYGVMCLLNPATLTQYAELGLPSGVAAAEVRAMYGGLQIAVGLLAGLGALRAEHERTALLALAFLFVGLASGRAVGLVFETGAGTYNSAAFVYEAISGALCLWLFQRAPAAAVSAA